MTNKNELNSGQHMILVTAIPSANQNERNSLTRARVQNPLRKNFKLEFEAKS